MKKIFDIKHKDKISYNPSGYNSYYDFLVWNEANKRFIPTICGHGGSKWLCNECSKRIFHEWKHNILNLKK